MDNLTHTLTGVLLARAGLRRVVPGATAVLVVASNLPDADVVAALLGSLTYLEYHRHLTHALVVAPLLGLVAALAAYRVPGWRFWPAWAVGAVTTCLQAAADFKR